MSAPVHARKPRTARSAASRSRTVVREEDRAIYTANDLAPDDTAVLARAEEILRGLFVREAEISGPASAQQFLRARLAHLDHEEFHAVWLDTHHRVIAVERMFTGSIDGASVHPREVVRAAIRNNAAAVIVAHNHPSGVANPSAADRVMTTKLRDALALVDVRLLDHFVIGAGAPASFVDRGWL